MQSNESRKPVWGLVCRYRIRRLSLLGIILVLPNSGCAIHRQSEREVARAISAWQRPRFQADDKTQSARQALTAPATPTAAPSPGVSKIQINTHLASHIRNALERNPSIRAAVANVQAKLEQVPQATALPDPLLRAITRPEPIQTAVGDVYFSLGLAQKIPFPARLDRAGKVAAAEVRMAIEQLNATRLRVIADVERAYFSIYLMDRYLELTAANRELLEDLVLVVETQYEAGRVGQQDVLRAQTAAAQMRDDENKYRLRRDSSVAALNILVDAPIPRPAVVTEVRDEDSIALDVERLIRLAEQHNPELAALAEQIERDRERVELARLAYWPDVTLGFEWNYLEGRQAFVPAPNPQTGVIPPYNRASENGDDNWAITLQMNLPIWTQRIEAAKRQARRQMLRGQHEARAARNMTAFRVYEAWTRIQAQRDTLRLLRTDLIPQARQTYAVTLTSYQAGSVSFLDVIESWRRRLDFDLMLHRETVDLELAFSDLQKEVGLQLIRGSDQSVNNQE